MNRNTILAAYLLAHLGIASAAHPSTPAFFARRDYTSLDSNWVQVADTNGDGIPDLIGDMQGHIEVLFGNGDGTFGPKGANTLTAMESSSSFVATDIDGDGKVDLVLMGDTHVNGGYPTGILVCLGNGDGTFQAGVFYQNGSGNGIGNPVVGDFNGDGILDAAVTGPDGVWLFTGKGGGALNPGVLAVSLTGVDALAAADFNGDKKLDLAVTLPSAGGGFAVLLGNGDGTFQSPTMFTQPKNPIGLATGILTKGGYPGIAVTTNSEVYLYFSNGAGSFSGPHYVNLPLADGIAIGDVNGDGFPDLVSFGGYIAFGTASGAFKPPIRYPVEDLQNNFYNVVLADLRNSGRIDIVTDDYFGISVLLNVGEGKFEDGEWIKVPGGAGCGATADFNGDGNPDLAVNTAAGVSILLGTGNAKSPFNNGATIALANTGCMVTGDLNGDGIPDLLIPASNPNALYVYLGNGDGTFTLKSTTPTPNSGGYVVLGDFNHDGKLDFATSGNLIALGNGDGTFQTPTDIVSNPPGSGFSGIAVGDINNDGWPDLVLTNGGIDPYYNAYVLLNNQQGGFSQVATNFGELTSQPVLADLNGDGNLDLVLGFPGGSFAYVYLGDGNGVFTKGPTLGGPFGSSSGFNIVADLNGDGIPDVGVLGADTLAIYVGKGNAAYEPPFNIGSGPLPGEVLVENLHRQSPSSGLPDIVAPDNSGSVMVLINKTK